MLVLTRKSGQVIKIGDAIVRLSGFSGRAQIAIDAPKEVRIIRGELLNEEENKKNVIS